MATTSAILINRYLEFIDQHIQHVVNQTEEEFLKINKIADRLHISHPHLTDTIQKETGHHPCYYYDWRIIETAKKLLSNDSLSIADITRKLTYDPSNFSKFFKKLTGITPREFRKNSFK